MNIGCLILALFALVGCVATTQPVAINNGKTVPVATPTPVLTPIPTKLPTPTPTPSPTAGVGKITLTSSSNKLTQWACSYDPVTVAYSETGRTSDAVLSLSSNSSFLKFFDDDLCTHEVTEISLKSSEDYSKKLYVKNAARESFTISASKKSDTSITSALPMTSMFAVYLTPGTDLVTYSSTFQNAIDLASASSYKDYLNGPSGPQTIVYVPQGVYRLKAVYMKDNVRLEVDARAIFKNEVPNGGAYEPCRTYLYFDSANPSVQGITPVKNISLVGVGVNSSKKSLAHNSSWDLTHSFTINHDPVQNECNGKGNPPIMVRNVNGFLIKNIYSIQNNSSPGDTLTNSGDSVVVFQSGMTHVALNPPFNDPQNGVYENHYNVNAISGYGPIQVQSANNVKFSKLFSRGGVAGRFETDVAGNYTTCSEEEKPCYAKGAKVDNITIDTVECLNGNSGVYLSAHNQLNGKIDVKNVKSENCYHGIVQANEAPTDYFQAGSFTPTIDGVQVIGSNYKGNGLHAQRPDPTHSTFIPDVKSNGDIVSSDSAAFWKVTPSNCSSVGEFNLPKICKTP